jgi:hypothetical protein
MISPEPLLQGPAAVPFYVLFLADFPISAFAAGVMFTSTDLFPTAWAIWGIIGTAWWYVLGRALEKQSRSVRESPKTR